MDVIPAGPRRELCLFELEALPWIEDVRRFAVSLSRDEAEAEDIVQDTYLRAFRSWHTFVVGTDCRRWLFTICRNVFLRRRERGAPTVSLDAIDFDAHRAAAGAWGVGERDTEIRVDLGPAIDRALAQIPEPFRATLLIVDVEDQTYEAAAARLGVPIGTIRSRPSRGRRMMQRQLGAHAHDAGLTPARRVG